MYTMSSAMDTYPPALKVMMDWVYFGDAKAFKFVVLGGIVGAAK
jgi:hypothetical protein